MDGRRLEWAIMTVDHPIPTNLREQMLKRVSSMDEESLIKLHDLDLLAEKMQLREAMSRQAETESAAGKWEGLTEVIRAYRMRNRVS